MCQKSTRIIYDIWISEHTRKCYAFPMLGNSANMVFPRGVSDMLIRFVVGRLSRDFFVAKEFEKRLPKYCRFEVFELKDSAKASDFLPKLKGNIIGLDASGIQWSSEQLADFLKSQQEVTFVIGPPQGLPVEVKKECKMLLSLSRMTFPHDLARVMLAEQVYRAFTILKGEKYHK